MIVDYLWGKPTEALLAALSKTEFAAAGTPMRLVEVGESAGATITLPAALLRSTALTILGTAGIPAWDVLTGAFEQVMKHAGSGKLRIETERVSWRGLRKRGSRKRDRGGSWLYRREKGDSTSLARRDGPGPQIAGRPELSRRTDVL